MSKPCAICTHSCRFPKAIGRSTLNNVNVSFRRSLRSWHARNPKTIQDCPWHLNVLFYIYIIIFTFTYIIYSSHQTNDHRNHYIYTFSTYILYLHIRESTPIHKVGLSRKNHFRNCLQDASTFLRAVHCQPGFSREAFVETDSKKYRM